MKYTKKQIYFTLIVACTAALVWRSFDIFLFFEGFFWNYYTKVFPNIHMSGLVRDISKDIVFPALAIFSILYSVKLNMNFLKISLCFALGFLFSYYLLKFTSNGGINYYWASEKIYTYKPRTFIQVFVESENLFYNLLVFFTPFIFWIASYIIRIFEYLKLKKYTIFQKDIFKNQYFHFAIIYILMVLSLSFWIIGMHIRQTQNLLNVIWIENVLAIFNVSLIISTVLLSYITYTKKIPISVFGISFILVFLIRACLLFFTPIVEMFPLTFIDIIISSFIFFAIASSKKHLTILSILSFLFFILFYISNFIEIYESIIILRTNGGVIYSTQKNNLYSALFILPITIAFYINDHKLKPN